MEGLAELKREIRGEILILHMQGRLDAISTPEIEKKVFDDINKGHVKLIFDFSGVDYISSAGMRMLLSTTKKLKGLDGHLVLCSISTNVMDVFKMSGFDHVLDLAEDKELALQRF